MKDHAANIIAERIAEIAANEAAIRDNEIEIAALNKDTENRKRDISNLSGQIRQRNPADLSTEQLIKVVDALYSERDYQALRSELSGLSSVFPGTEKTYLFIYRLNCLTWLSVNFDLSAETVDAYLKLLLQDDPEIPCAGPVKLEVKRAEEKLTEAFQNQGKSLTAIISDNFHLLEDIVKEKLPT